MTRNNTENWFQNQLCTLQFYFFLRGQARQFHPRVHSAKLGEMVRNWRIVSLGHLNTSLCARSPCPAFSFNTEEEKRRGRFRHHPHSLQMSIFNVCAEIPSLLQHLCLISSLGSTARFTRRAVCSTASSFNLIIMAAPVATLPCVPILFTPCQASLTSDHDVLPSQTLPASFLTSYTL